MIYLLFFLSGFSALVYQLVWVRVFGNTIYSASLVVAVFMLGLGVGSFAIGAWADRRYARSPHSLLRAYAYVELAIAVLALGLSLLLPHLADLMAGLSSSSTLASATSGVSAVTDDRPVQEYGVRSLLSRGESVPAALVDVNGVAEWCPGSIRATSMPATTCVRSSRMCKGRCRPTGIRARMRALPVSHRSPVSIPRA